jgi:hypothetical protein
VNLEESILYTIWKLDGSYKSNTHLPTRKFMLGRIQTKEDGNTGIQKNIAFDIKNITRGPSELQGNR